jgi:hypothetical protein
MASEVGDPIVSSDYDALQTLVQQILGTIAPQYGYGQTNLVSRPYPFETTITNIAKGENPTVTATNHGLRANEIIYIDNISSGMIEINATYVKVLTVLTVNSFTIQIDTSDFTSWAGTARLSQFIVSANQFENLRTDLRRVRTHQIGTLPNADPVAPTAGTLIRLSAFTPFFNTVTTANSQRFYAGAVTDFVNPTQLSQSATWSDQRVARLTIQWPNLNDLRQFFNCGGYIVFSSSLTGGNAKGQSWNTMLTNSSLTWFGASTRSGMGNRPGTWRNGGYYTLPTSGAAQEIHRANMTGAYSSNFYTINARILATNTRSLQFDFLWFDGHNNSFAQDVTGTLRQNFVVWYPDGSITLATNPPSYTYTLIQPTAFIAG